MSLGERLRAERERLHLSQAELAERLGIHRNTQVRYETDRREPDSTYLEAIRTIGIDVEYVLFGVPEGTVDCPFLRSLGDDARHLISLADCRYNASGRRRTSNSLALQHWRACQDCPKNPIKRSVSIEPQVPDIDGRLLTEVIEGLEAALERMGNSPSPEKKARAVVMLYRAFRISGKVDSKIIEEAAALAS